MEFVLGIIVLLIAAYAYEYRFRKPDQIVLADKRTGVAVRRSRLYPRHFCIPMTTTTYSFAQTIEASAKGNLDMKVKLAVTVAASLDNLSVLVKVGGWTPNAVAKASKELETFLLGYVKEYTELHEIEELSSDKIRVHLQQRVQESKRTLGLEIITLTITSFDPVNPQIADAIRQREHARIMEQTEALNQRARIAATKVRLNADEEIALLENGLEVRKLGLKHAQLQKEAALAAARVGHELQLKRMQLDFDKEELHLLKGSPELLLLTPQAARLAEASQSLKNARTVVSFSPADGAQGTELLGMFQSLVQSALDAFTKRKSR